MAYTIKMHREASKDYKRLSGNDLRNIDNALEAISENPFKAGKKLKGSKKHAAYRTRVGDYRIGYVVKKKEVIVIIMRISDHEAIYGLLKKQGVL